ncbi:hypothetical protein Tco_0873521 [Tanacetum coccineum]|uniref:Uncharacterized protein n=1 Tax=Tanacetum coccineum TaxID=301880 RepID=A0ABQ5BJ15_9ASTR
MGVFVEFNLERGRLICGDGYAFRSIIQQSSSSLLGFIIHERGNSVGRKYGVQRKEFQDPKALMNKQQEEDHRERQDSLREYQKIMLGRSHIPLYLVTLKYL